MKAKDFLSNLIDTDDIGGSGILDSYVDMDIDKNIQDVENHAKEYILCVIKSCLESTEIDIEDSSNNDTKLLVASSILESSTLATLRELVIYSIHAVRTKMRHINSGGHTDIDNFDSLIRLSKHTADMVSKLTVYTRSLNSVIKTSVDEIQLNKIKTIIDGDGNNKNMLPQSNSNNNMQYSDFEETSNNEDTYNLTKPIRSFRDLIKQISNERDGNVDNIKEQEINEETI